MLETKKEFAQGMVQHAVILKRGGTLTIDHPTAANLHSGTLYNPEGSSGVAKGLCVFLSVPATFNGNTSATMDSNEVALRLDSNNLKDAHISALTKSQVQIPEGGHGVRDTLQNHLYMLDFLFDKKSYLYGQLEKLLAATMNQQHRLAFDQMCHNNPDNVAKFLQSIDLKFQLFLGSCASAATVTDIDFDILEFSDEIRKIRLTHTFEAQLPLAVQQVVNKIKNPKAASTKTRGGGGGGNNNTTTKVTDEEITSKKKRKQGEQGSGNGETKGGKGTITEPAKNTNPIDQTWIKKGESYKTVFHPYIADIPKLDGKPICAKYHVKGFCGAGDSCARKASHSDKGFDDDFKKQVGDWIQMCRDHAEEGNN